MRSVIDAVRQVVREELSAPRAHTSLLNTLHATFNGEPGRIGEAIGLMESAKQQAMTMTAREFAPGKTAGPTFTYRPLE